MTARPSVRQCSPLAPAAGADRSSPPTTATASSSAIPTRTVRPPRFCAPLTVTTWVDAGNLPGSPSSAGLLGGRPAVALYGFDGGMEVMLDRADGSWTPLDLMSAVDGADDEVGRRRGRLRSPWRRRHRLDRRRSRRRSTRPLGRRHRGVGHRPRRLPRRARRGDGRQHLGRRHLRPGRRARTTTIQPLCPPSRSSSAPPADRTTTREGRHPRVAAFSRVAGCGYRVQVAYTVT